MGDIVQKRIGWIVLWPLCLALLTLHFYLAYHGHPQNRGLSYVREILVSCDLLLMASFGCYYRWGPVLFWPTVGAFIGSIIAVSGTNAFKLTFDLILTGILFGLFIAAFSLFKRQYWAANKAWLHRPASPGHRLEERPENL